MHKIIALIFILTFSVGTIHAQKKTKKEDAKPIEKVIRFNELTHDFGNLQEGDKVSCEFTYKNLSRTPLVLERVRASCGCTVPVWSKEPLKRRKKDKITVTFDSKGKPGVFKKRITVQTNQGVQYLHIKGVVKRVPQK